ncbi:Zinc-binding alcohol dehydrogenase domain-containing protein cipB [Pleurostoma richardsiae]|uniref:Zinc-binding alcohol dehydrogenase domain-containing protein cipB n=1 Tax=Pleurostoma richardsiae TaxID=41990 RepID=A0AA38RN37_9PEZI|nr:Zinc-binding alcohol dehydrogenase domain-containing protein cipB [Pleurostoma richardsiae]
MAKQEANLAAVLPAIATDLVVEEREVPSPGPDDVLIRNHAIALNPVDWKRQSWGFMISSYPVVLGADIAGTVVEVGSSVSSFKPGDRVLGFADAFISGDNNRGAYQTYTAARAISTAKLPDAISFQQGATLPTAMGTAAMALFDSFGLPRPTRATAASALPGRPSILVWGGASSVGSVAIQLARLAGLTVFATASERHHTHLHSLGASVLVDYHSPTAVQDLLAAVDKAGTPLLYALDTISTAETAPLVTQALSRSGGTVTKKLAHLIPWPEKVARPGGIEYYQIQGEELWNRRQDLSAWLCNEISAWLEGGAVVPKQYRVVEGGLTGLQNALNELKKGVSGEKLVVELN